MRKLLFAGLISLAASTAQGQQRVPLDSVWAGTKCTQSGALDTFKGEIASTELATRLMMASRAHKVRWVPYGQTVKMNAKANRVTVHLDQQNRVISAACG